MRRDSMREITIYEIQPEFVLGDSKNLKALKEKLSNDKVLLADIESDYNKDNAKYKEEFNKAKINYLFNEYTYNWELLKFLYEKAILPDLNHNPSDPKEKLKTLGWMLPIELMNSNIISNNPDETTEEIYIRYLHSCFDAHFTFAIDDNNAKLNEYYRQAICNYKNGYYYSCAVSLFPIIESFHQITTNFNENDFYKIKHHLLEVQEKMENVIQMFTTRINYYVELVKQFNDLVTNHYFKASKVTEKEPPIINRNRIMHGIFTRNIDKKDCLQLFCVISNMKIIKTMIDANSNLNTIAEKIEQLKNQK